MTKTTMKQAARAVADVTQGMLLATIDIKAPPERVFRAVTTEELTRWWGSEDTYRTTHYQGDVRVGGKWKTEGQGPDGKFSVHGEFLEVDPPRKLVQTWQYDWDTSDSITTITWRFEAIEGGTRVVVRHEGFGDAHDACTSHAQGWEQVLTWLSQNDFGN